MVWLSGGKFFPSKKQIKNPKEHPYFLYGCFETPPYLDPTHPSTKIQIISK
ncbi:hypothetical protein HanIR_Chr10g0477521 [Helianthus annuus]|nr:hypothetical protein HanIR_Chr10g0477521 [Helianthus annuus]